MTTGDRDESVTKDFSTRFVIFFLLPFAGTRSDTQRPLGTCRTTGSKNQGHTGGTFGAGDGRDKILLFTDLHVRTA